MAACAAALIFVCSSAAAGDPAADESAATGSSTGPETIVVSVTKKPPLICKWDTPLGSRVARKTCHRSADVEQAQQSTREAAKVVDEAVTQYPTGG